MKLKSRKSIIKRFKITAKKKLLGRPAGQDHFNVKNSGNKTRLKRRTKKQSGGDTKVIRKQIPYI